MSASIQRPPTAHTEQPADTTTLRTLIDDLIAEQGSLQTPVARFAEAHDRQADLANHYRTLIPLSKPGPGQQYAFEVSLDRCTGCKACVSACHSLNGLDEEETWRDTGALVGGNEAPGWQQTVTTACHHCEDPGCLNGCPVGAYEKEQDTGIVRHLDDQCIGCSYCILKCPYDVPKYSKKRGIVRKCDMCHQRLAEGEAPACVQACPTEAIRIVTVDRAWTPGSTNRPSKPFFSSSIINPQSGIPASTTTLPTTRYIGRKFPISAHAADRNALVAQPTHWPLVLMLVLTQAGIGMLGGDLLTPGPATIAGAILFYLGMAGAVFHLGQPLKAWRFFLGLRTSWLSREILAFGIFAPVPAALAVVSLWPDITGRPGMLLSTAAMAIGVMAVFTSAMIYHDTGRRFWRLPCSGFRFFGTTALFATLAWATRDSSAAILFTAITILKLAGELMILRHLASQAWTADQHTARMHTGPLRPVLVARLALGSTAVAAAFITPWIALPALVLAELAERILFFRTVHAPKMPGNFGPPAKAAH